MITFQMVMTMCVMNFMSGQFGQCITVKNPEPYVVESHDKLVRNSHQKQCWAIAAGLTKQVVTAKRLPYIVVETKCTWDETT